MLEIANSVLSGSIVELSLAVAVMSALLITVWNGLWIRQQIKRQRMINRRLREDNRALSRSAVGMGHKVMETERKLNEALKKQFAMMNGQPEHPSYDQASKLIAMGATEKDLVTSCGFSLAEAELLLSLNRQSKQVSAVH